MKDLKNWTTFPPSCDTHEISFLSRTLIPFLLHISTYPPKLRHRRVSRPGPPPASPGDHRLVQHALPLGARWQQPGSRVKNGRPGGVHPAWPRHPLEGGAGGAVGHESRLLRPLLRQLGLAHLAALGQSHVDRLAQDDLAWRRQDIRGQKRGGVFRRKERRIDRLAQDD